MKSTPIIFLLVFAAIQILQILLLIPIISRLAIESAVHVQMILQGIGGPFDWQYVLRGRN